MTREYMTRSEELEDLALISEDEGSEVYVQAHEGTGVIEYIEVDGREIYNENYYDEVSDAYWTDDAYRVAERSMY